MTTSSLSFFVPGIPITQGSMKAFNGPHHAIVTHAKSGPLMSWRGCVATFAMKAKAAAGWVLDEDGPIGVDMTFWLPRPKSLPRKVVHPVKQRADLDKLVRAVNDALTGVLWRNDAQIIVSRERKGFAGAPEVCGVKVDVRKIQGEG